MTNKIISNSSRTTAYFSSRTSIVSIDLKSLIDSKLITSESLDAHIKNTRNFAVSPDVYTPVIDGVYPIPPRSCWSLLSSGQFQKRNSSVFNLANSCSAEDFFIKLKRYAAIIKDHPLGIESSGGLDTALLIVAARYLKLDPVMSAIRYKSYEFRTENIIQNRLKECGNKNIEICGDLAMVFSGLLSTPLHALPSVTSLYSNRHLQIANACVKKNIKILLNGNGGDALLCDDFPLAKTRMDKFSQYSLDDPWANSFIYNPRGIHYFSGFCLSRVLNSLHNMRIGKGEDLRKLWAREFFKDYFPAELANYSYKSAFDGLTSEAVDTYSDDIRNISKVAYDLTGHYLLKDINITKMISEFSDSSTDSQVNFFSAVSFSNWVYGLSRDGYL